uniref:L-Fucosyltransferase n=1 Tax=Cacopsylla melanoneura TaxID=428564 RepID=A0A8D9A9A8_9HEMI
MIIKSNPTKIPKNGSSSVGFLRMLKILYLSVAFVLTYYFFYLSEIQDIDNTAQIIDNIAQMSRINDSQDNCPNKIVWIRESRGHNGNKMMDYATVYVVELFVPARELKGGHVGVLCGQRGDLDKMFKNIVLDDLPTECQKRKEKQGFDFYNWDAGLELHGIIYNRSHSVADVESFSAAHDDVSIKYYKWFPILYLKYLDELKYTFQFRDHIMTEAQTTIELVRRLYAGSKKPLLFVGTHVRRGDYKEHLKALYHMDLLGPSFFVKGMEYFNDKFSDKYLVIFLAVSNDDDWVTKHLKFEHFYIVSKNAESDMALLSLCNHTITDYGTFGFWPSLFHGGEHYTTNAYEDFIVATMYQIKRWTVINVTSPLVTSPYSDTWLREWGEPETALTKPLNREPDGSVTTQLQ